MGYRFASLPGAVAAIREFMRPDFSAIGRFGQFIYVSPQHEAVFVRNGPGRGGWGDSDWTALFYFAAERL